MKHLLNVCNISGAEVEPVDIITFGSPCQDMSVAGKREGMKHSEQGDEETTRSGLFYEAIRIIKEMRDATNGEYPKFAVWENVPGAFSSNKGRDFHAVLQAFCSVCDDTVSIPEPYDKKRTKLVWSKAGEIVGDNYSIAWRTLDAQYWGVPQRRKRIYLVADFTGGSAGKILFESEGVSGYSAEGFRAWQGAAADAGEGFGETGTFCLNDQGGQRMDLTEDVTNTLRAESHHPPLVFENHSQDSRYTGPLDVAQTVYTTSKNSYHTEAEEDVANTLVATDYKDPPTISEEPYYIVRRLTPTECARLQGFPDWWGELAPYDPADADFWESVRKTHAEINGKKYKPVKNLKAWYDKLHTDSAEYKMWGNGIALPCAQYVLQGIAEQGAQTLGSLFDGSGGFPLAGVLNGINPIWASEVEPYCIAVTKSRFG
jgi:DNA (cytosine-5)-methyltransferase 1